ncbi:hypothetical protein QBC46DRAFT_13887 [Diplogelasinospora grovesii]|uniref:MARVEL domain-containing protein n=1 Tax=Diplogelasinospora grovesii TaxID=303347 RepID=A0AAN6NGY9_9PEZI|nr:hypothetical protein QBC46DRAFT_13887 [Diplogelasinospora grovesii]
MELFGKPLSYWLFVALLFFEFVLAVTVCGLYGVELNRASKAGQGADGRWVYAEVVGGLSALTAILCIIPYILRFAVIWAWNTVLFILWIALFGIFGSIYIHQDPKGNADVQRMKNAVWVVLASALLWLVSAVTAFIYWWRHKERHTRFTGRARV